MRVLLTQAKFTEMNTILPPIGLLYIATVLENEGHIVKVLDIDYSQTDGIKQIEEFNPDLIGFSIMTPYYKNTKEVIKKIRGRIKKKVLICVGGCHPTGMPTETLLDLDVDFVVAHEGEYTLKEFCAKFDKHKDPFKNTKGIFYKKNNKIIANKPREFIKNLDELPIPKREFLDFEKYLTPPGIIKGYAMERTASIIFSRGCPFDCIYCGNRLMWQGHFRRRSPEKVVEEVEYLVKRYKLNGVLFVDDNFTSGIEWVKDFCSRLRAKNINIKWGCNSRVDTLTDEMVKEMKKAGCIQLDFGVESGSDKVLKALNKRTNTKMIERAFKIVKDNKMRAMASFMLGNPEEEEEDIQKTFELAKRINPNYTQFFYLTPLPGTELYKMAKEKGWIVSKEDYSQDWTIRQSEYPVIKINLSRERIKYLRNKMQNHFAFRNFFSFRNMRFGFKMFIISAKSPLKLSKLIMKTFKDRRLDDFVEGVITIYRNEIQK